MLELSREVPGEPLHDGARRCPLGMRLNAHTPLVCARPPHVFCTRARHPRHSHLLIYFCF